jgi:competence protein ComGC
MNGKKFGISEILLFLVTIALFTLIVFFEINPVKAVSDTYNINKEKEVERIMSAIEEYSLLHKGQLPSSIPAISSPLMINNTQTSGIGAGFNVMGNALGIPNCIQAGAFENSCLSIVKGSVIANQIAPYLSGSLPIGDFYIAKNVYGTKVVVFCTDLGEGSNIDVKGYGVAYQIYKI